MKMRKRLKLSAMTVFFAMLLGFAVMSIGTEQAFAMEGSGSQGDPYQISTYAELKEFAGIVNGTNGATQNRSACAKLTADIECDDETWAPIGPASGYDGSFDGNGHEISKVKASSGLFSTIAGGGIVKNLTVKIISDANDVQSYMGGIANENSGKIENCTVECGDILAKTGVGAVAGTNKDNGTIENCTAKIDGDIIVATENSSARYAGGVVGYNRGTVKGCRAYGEGSISVAEGNGSCGGIAGWNSSKIESCICEGSLKIYNNQNDYSGGIAGYNSNNIDDCLVYGDVEVGVLGNGDYVGGLVARMNGGTCSNSFYNSSKPPTKDAYPIVSDRKDGTITGCYYNTASNCIANGYGTAISDIYWLKCDSGITPTIKADDKKKFAEREFVYSGNDVTLSYDGLSNNQSVTYSVNGEEIDGNAFKMPQQETSVEARVGIAISSLEDLKKSTVYSGSGQSPGTVICSGGRIEEEDYIVTKYQDSKGQETTEPPTDADTYTVTIRGINKYAGNTTIEFTIVKADPKITKYPEALELTYNGNDQELLIGGTATGGTILFRLSTEDESSSNEKIPTAKDAGKYDILYKVKGDKNHNDLSEQKLQTEIKKANITITADDKNCTDLDKTAPLTWTMEDEADKWYETEKADIALVVTDDARSVVDPKTAPEGRYTITPSWGTENKNYDATFVKGIFDTDHQYGEWTKFDAKQHQRVCEHDAAHIEKEDHKWDEGKVTTPATEQAEGIKTYTCTVCKATRTETITKTETITETGAQDGKRAVPAQISTKGRDALIIGWKDVEGAEGYDVFFAKCNHKNKKWNCKVVKTIEGGNNLSWTQTGLKKGTSYKFYVRPYVMENGVKKYIGKSPMMHAYTGNGNKKYTNAKSVKVRNVKKGKLTLAQGKTFKIKASVKKLKKNKKLMPKSHVPTLRYMTSDGNVATVSKSGKITAKGKGTCYVYVYAHNGVSKKIKVTVK